MKINLPPDPDDLTPDPPGDPNTECKKSVDGEHEWFDLNIHESNDPVTTTCAWCGASR